MSTLPTVDSGTLGWVKSEIEDTALQARNALQQFENDSSDKSPLKTCSTHLHQVHGTLTMVELDAAARLVQESESLTNKLSSGVVPWSDECGVVLRRAIDDLSSYLEGLQTSPIPSPLRLVAPINRILSVQNSEPITDLDLFSPDLSATAPEPNLRGKIATDVFLKLADDLRIRFERALLDWLRNTDDRAAIQEFVKVFKNMVSIERRGSLRQLWWISGGLSEVMLEGGIEITDNIRFVMAKVNEQLKYLQDISQASKRRAPPDELIKRILLILAHNESRSDLVADIKIGFGLDEWVNEDSDTDLPDIAELTKRLYGFINEAESDLDQVQNMLARYFSPQGKSEDIIDRLYNRLDSLRIAAERNELGVIEDLLAAMVEVIIALRKNSISDLDQASLQLAGALLFIQDSASGNLRPGPEWQAQAEASVNILLEVLDSSNAILNDQGMNSPQRYTAIPNAAGGADVTKAAANEIRGELQYVEHNLEQVAGKTSPISTLSGIDGHLKRVEGTFEILEQADAAELSERLRFRLQSLASGDLDFSNRVLDASAMAVGTLAACANTLESGGNLDSLSATINRAIAELNALDRVDDETILDFSSVLDEPDQIETDDIDVEDIVFDVNDDFAESLSFEIETDSMTQEAENLSVETSSAPSMVVVDDGLDEIVEIFYEEADEVKQELVVKKDLWRNNPEDHATLTDLRRCFHTLKGSGRFAEADSISELSWSVEQLLNSVMDGDIKPSGSLHDFIDRVYLVLVELIATRNPKAPLVLEPWLAEADGLKNGTSVEIEAIPVDDISADENDLVLDTSDLTTVFDIDETLSIADIDEEVSSLEMDDIFTLEDNDDISTDSINIDEESIVLEVLSEESKKEENNFVDFIVDNVESEHILEDIHQPNDMETEADFLDQSSDNNTFVITPANDIDSHQRSVVEIFQEEMQNHIEIIARNVNKAREDFVNWRVTAELLRTSHTLKGVTRSVGLNVIARMSDAFDDLLIYLDRRGVDVEEVDLVLIDQSGRLLRYAMTRLDESNRLPGDVSVQFDELANAFTKRLKFLDSSLIQDPLESVSESYTSPSGLTKAEDDELLEAFREEGQEILGRMEQELQRWEGEGDTSKALAGLRRELHTLKGGARAVGWSALGDLGHSTETLLEDETQVSVNSDKVISLIQEVHDLIAVVISVSEQLMLDDLIKLNRKVLDFNPNVEDDIEFIEQPSQLDAELEAVEHKTSSLEERAGDLSPAAFRTDTEARAVRVSTEVLDELVNYSGEVSILRSRLQQQVSMVRSNLGELNETVRHFREQLRDLEIESEAQMLATTERMRDMDGQNVDFDPLEMDRFSRLQTVARSLGDSLSNLVSVQAGITEFAGDAENTLQQQSHVSDSLQEGLLRTRMIPFASVVPRFRHLTRQTSRQLERNVRIVVTGDHVEVDRKILDQMSSSFEHMIRNSIVHGLEGSDERISAGKPEEGVITIQMGQDGNDIVINFSDDGRGIDKIEIAEKARSRGLLSAGQEMNDEDLMRILTTPGVSTSQEITQLSGRGVGMDVVADMIRELGGSITVSSEEGKGTVFALRVPVTLAISHALLVYAGEQMFALPARLIYNVLRIPYADILEGDSAADAYITYNDQKLPVLNLAQRLGLPFFKSDDTVAKVVVVRAGIREIALLVESISDTREIVVKPLNEMLSEIPGVGGVTMLGDGSIVLILDVPGLWQNRNLDVQEDSFQSSVSQQSESTTVMVVDDSMTVRNVMGRDLQNNGYEVILAKDGVDAIEQLRHTVPDILLVDLEMPRMDGFELTTRVRSDDRLKDIPVLIITSRSGARHRDQAMGLGASGYMSKPYRLDELVGSINDLTLESSSENTTLH